MGKIADMMLEGEMCQGCGEILDSGFGVPTYCGACIQDLNLDEFGQEKTKKKVKQKQPKQNRIKVNCPYCKKRVSEIGLSNHIRDSHKDLETNLVITYRSK